MLGSMAGTTNYPGALDAWVDKVDGVDPNSADDVNDAHARIIALETAVGTNPAGAAASVKARLDAVDTALAGKLSTSAATATYAPISGSPNYSSIVATDLGYDVIVLMGQSNMVGNGTTINLNYTDPVNSKVWRWVTSANGTAALASYKSQITLASDPLGHPDTLSGVGPGMEFARWYSGLTSENRRVLLVPTAVQATQLVTTTPPTWNSTVVGSLLDNAIGYANAAITAAGANARVKAFLWLQGESDALASASSSAYQTALDALITKVRSQVTGATSATPFVIASMVPSWAATPNGTSVSIATVHAATPGRVSYTGYAAGPTGSGNIHYTEAEQRTLGRSLVTAYVSALTNTLIPAVPGQPTGLTATPGVSQVALSWTSPTNVGVPALSDYLVEYKLTSSGTWLTFSDGVSTTTTATVTGLTGGSSYDFRVTAVNGTGNSTPSSTVSATPTTATVPGIPTGLTATPGGSGAIAMSWTAPASNGGSAITDYRVQYSTDGTNFTTFSDGVSTTTSATITGLVTGTNYTVRVAAINAVGTGTDTAGVTCVAGTAANLQGLPALTSATVTQTFDVTIGMAITTAVNGTISAIYFATKGALLGGACNVGVYASTAASSPVATASATLRSTEGWTRIPLPSPVTVTAGQTFVIAGAVAQAYPILATGVSWPLTSGNLTAPSGSNPRFANTTGNTLVAPSSVGSTNRFGIDVELTT